ncbi:hypothetical protein ITP53_02900 [Nonomuraea sp. K274]|uniref:Uncharacterized protein n=1 Tax=Nonomuraea cypriaca TaxID=1187855 RepID=A0A931A1X9_9ACTN|nr:hypothetical protein [Nonomuraea cypriaca]MBF8184706.1 hypothetical protein [Nonomuraea cypriaca]
MATPFDKLAVRYEATAHIAAIDGQAGLSLQRAQRADVLGGTTILRKIETYWDGIGGWMK